MVEQRPKGITTAGHCLTTCARGSALLWTTVAITVIGGFAALAFDISRLRVARAELQVAAEAAAMNGANGLQDGSYLAKAQAAARENQCLGQSIVLNSTDVTPGNWSNHTFTPNQRPRNALRVSVSRTSAGGNPISLSIANFINRNAADIAATATVAVVRRSDYQWTGIESARVEGGNALFTIDGYDASNPAAATSSTEIESSGPVAVTGPVRIDGNVRYGTSYSGDASSKVTGSIARATTPLLFPPGTVAANLAGAASYLHTLHDLTYSGTAIAEGGTYVVNNVNMTNCTVTFTGPATIILTGSATLSNATVYTYNNLPANLRIIAAGNNTSITIDQLWQRLYADFYAPTANFTLQVADKTYGVTGRGVFKTMSIFGKGADAPLRYDRSLAVDRFSSQAMIVR